MSSKEHNIDAKVRADTTGFSKGMSDAGRDLDKGAEGFSKYGSEALKAGKASQSFVETNRAHMESLGRDAVILGAGILAGVGVALHAYSEFSGRMAQVASLSKASAAEMEVLTTAALTMGTAYGLSANDVADAQIELVKAGVSVKDMMGGALPGALALAAAGQIDVGAATEIATIALTQFNLKGKDVPHVADLLAAGADKALGGVDELGQGLKQGGLIASQFGLTIEDTVGTLAAFANAGLLGSDAGTSLKTMLLALANPSKEAAAAMQEVGINAYDAQGQFIGVTALAGQLKDKLGPLAEEQRNQALATIFGTDAMRSASVLMKEGSTGIQQWIQDVDDQGFAATQAAGKMNSLNGDFKKLNAELQTGLIQMGAAGNGFMRPVIQGVTDAVKAFNELEEPVKGGIMALAGMSGAGLLLVGTMLSVIPKIHDSVSALQALRGSAPKTASVLGDLGKAAAIAAVSIAALKIAASVIDSMRPAAKSVDETTQAIIRMTKAGNTAALDDIFKGFQGGTLIAKDINGVADAIYRVNNMTDKESVNKWFNDISGGMLSDSLKTNREQIVKVDEALTNLVAGGQFDLAAQGFKAIAEGVQAQGGTLEEVAQAAPGYIDSLRKIASQTGVDVSETELLNWALGKVPQSMLDAQKATEGQAKAAEVAAKHSAELEGALADIGLSASGAVTDLTKFTSALVNAGLINLDARETARQYKDALDDVTESVKVNGVTLDTNTAQGLANERALDGIAAAGLRNVVAMAKNGAGHEELQGSLKGTYDDLLKNVRGFTATDEEAVALTRDILKVPKGVSIESWMNDAAKTMAADTKAKVDAIPAYKAIQVVLTYSDIGQEAAMARRMQVEGKAMGGPIEGKAHGGPLDGPGPKGVDSKLFWGAPGEHVWTAREVDAAGGHDAMHAMRKAVLNPATRALQYATPAPPAAAKGGAPTPVYVTVYATNPLTGEQIIQTMEGVADNAIGAANRDLGRGSSV